MFFVNTQTGEWRAPLTIAKSTEISFSIPHLRPARDNVTIRGCSAHWWIIQFTCSYFITGYIKQNFFTHTHSKTLRGNMLPSPLAVTGFVAAWQLQQVDTKNGKAQQCRNIRYLPRGKILRLRISEVLMDKFENLFVEGYWNIWQDVIVSFSNSGRKVVKSHILLSFTDCELWIHQTARTCLKSAYGGILSSKYKNIVMWPCLWIHRSPMPNVITMLSPGTKSKLRASYYNGWCKTGCHSEKYTSEKCHLWTFL